MNSKISSAAVAVFTSFLLAGSIAGSASATDFCTSVSDPGCPAGATFAPTIEFGMTTNANDGIKDRVFLPAGSVLPSNGTNFVPSAAGSDDLEVIGAGRNSTILTTNNGGNIYLVNLTGIFLRDTTFRDLKFLISSSFPDTGGRGAALQSYGVTLERVDFESRNPTAASNGTDAIGNAINGATLKDVKIYGSSGGGFGAAIKSGSFNPGDTFEITNSDIVDVRSGIGTTSGRLPVHISNTHIRSDSGFILDVYEGQSTIENSVIEAGAFTPFYSVSSNGTSPDASLVVKNSTILNLGGATPAFDVTVGNTANGDAGVTVSDSVVYGFAKTWETEAPVGIYGDASFEIRYSNFENPGTKTGDGTVTSSVGNISQNPGFVALNDYHLSASSPMIDTGDPAPGGLLDDIEGTIRPLDGNGDGTAVRDMGAYEYVPPPIVEPTCQDTPALCPPVDTTGPKITKVKFIGPKGKKAGSLKFNLSEAAITKVVFKPIGKKKPKRKTFKATRNTGKATQVKVKIKKGKLKKGKYRLTIKSTDDSGNKSKTFTKKVKVK